MAYLSYLCAEIFHMSGILAITFCGITMKNYVERNVSNKSQTTIKYAMKMLSSSSETIIFMFLGVATIHDEHVWNWWFTILPIVFCSVFRCIGVVILVGIANRYRLHKLGAVDQFVMMYGGLRGAVAFALVLLIDSHVVPHAHMFVTTTIAVVYWTVFVQGITIKPLVKFLNVKTSTEKEPSMNERISGRFIDHIMAGMEGILGEFGHLHLRDMYKHIDNKYIKPCLLRENHVKDPKIIETYHHITNQEVEQMMKNNPQSISELKINLKESKSISTIFNSSQTNVAHVENLDMKEINFNQSRKDLTEAKIHHMLTEVMAKPQLRQRKYSKSDLGPGFVNNNNNNDNVRQK
jgi:sodium/hydrogen exchanger-like protein 3